MKKQSFYLLMIFMTAFGLFANLHAQEFKEQQLAAGDAIRIQIWQLSDRSQNLIKNLNSDYTIDGYGYITLPMVGLFKVEGKTPREIAQEVKKKYADYFEEPFIIVRPLIRVVLLGEFIRPGAYRIDPKESLWRLIEMSGGPTSKCDLKKLSVNRNGKPVNKNLLKSFEKGYSLTEIGVKSGDQIYGPERNSFSIMTVLNYANFAVSFALLYLRLKEGRY